MLVAPATAYANCPLNSLFGSVSKDGQFFDEPGGRPTERFSAGDSFDYSFEVVRCDGGWIKVLYYGDNKHRWIVADKVGRLRQYARLNRRAVDQANEDAAASGASGVSGLPRLRN